MGENLTRHGRSMRRVAAASAITMLMGFAAASCGSDADQTGDVAPGATSGVTSASDPAQNGEQLARSYGCAGCHGSDFGGGAGPTWIGLAGSEVNLADGSTMAADDAYLTRAIAEPAADLVAGYNLKMPVNSLSDDEIADVVAYIKTLSER